MTPLFRKLNLPVASAEIVVVDAPDTFEPALAEVRRALPALAVSTSWASRTSFALVFALTEDAVTRAAGAASESTRGDAIVWLAYPKKTSKRYQCTFNRDTGFAPFGRSGFEPVRQVAIDDDWSALRFRRVEFIKNLTRNPSMRLT